MARMRWGKMICPLLLGCLMIGQGSYASAGEVSYSFLPLVHDNHFIVLKVLGKKGIAVEVYDDLSGESFDDKLQIIRSLTIHPTQRFYLKRQISQTQISYEIKGSPHEDPLSFLGIQQNEKSIFISHTDGIDEIALSDLLKARDTLPIQTHHALPNATGVAFLTGIFSNDLVITSQWDPEKNSSILSLHLDDAQWSAINEWEVNFPILGMALKPFSLEQSNVNLYLAGGETGLHTFIIHLEESTVHPNFIERKENLDPWVSDSSSITGVWISDHSVHYACSTGETFTSFHDMTMTDLKLQGQYIHDERLKRFLDSPFYTTHRNKAFKNGLLASWPFDADKLVDWVGFDLDQDLDEQVHALGLYLSPEEKEKLSQTFRNWKIGGEITGDAVLFLLLAGANTYMRHMKNVQTAKNIQAINEMRSKLNITQSTISAQEGSKWLSEWKSEELFIQDVSPFTHALSRLGPASQMLTPPKALALIDAIQKRKFFVRPFERVMSAMGLAHPIVQKLEYWNLKKIQKFLKLCDPKDLEKLWLAEQTAMDVHVPFVANMNRLITLENLEELSDIQKLEQYQLSLQVKVDLLHAIQKGRIMVSTSVSPKTLTAMDWLWSQTQVPIKNFSELLIEASRSSEILDQTEECFRLNRILELNQVGHKLTDIEKIEKMKLLIKSGWTGNGAEALSAAQVSRLVSRLDEIYDFERLRQSRYLDRLMTHGNLKQSALYTTYSDIANFVIEIWLRNRDGRPLFTPTTVHNVAWNSWIMVPIFLSSGLRAGKCGKVFLFLFNASNSSYVGQKLGKWGGDVLDTQELTQRWNHGDVFFVPSPQMPISELPDYFRRDIFEYKDPTFSAEWALFDGAWCLLLSTPRGYGVTLLSKQWASRPAFDKDGAFFAALRQGVRSSPVFLNETAGAGVYTWAYPQIFDDVSFQLKILNSQFDYIDPWQTGAWDKKPQVQLSLAIFSSSKPENVRFELHRDASTVQYIEVPEAAWKNPQEQIYELTWAKEIDITDHPSLYEIQNLQISNKGRWVGSSFNPFAKKEFEEGKELQFEKPLTLIVQAQEPFISGLFKALLSLSKDASTEFYKGHKYYAAGIAYMIGQFLPDDLVIQNQSTNLALDTLKEAKKITHSIQFSDYPITKEALDLLTDYLDRLAHHALPEGAIAFQEILDSKSWVNHETLKRLSAIRDDILEETRPKWVIFDEGNKVDWATFNLYKGYCGALAKLYRWHYKNIRADIKDRLPYLKFLVTLDEMTKFHNDLITSWTASLWWSDQILVEFADQFRELDHLLKEAH